MLTKTTNQKIALITALLAVGMSCSAQIPFKFPSLSEASAGFRKGFKVPTIKDFDKFSSDYTKHLKMLDRRSEKAFQKGFIKFCRTEDELLYLFCESNELHANSLFRSSTASYGKLYRDRNRYGLSKQDFDFNTMAVQTVASISNDLKPEGSNEAFQDNEKSHLAKTERFGSKMYADYMKKRVSIYKEVFKDGSKKQKKLTRKLNKQAAVWQSYKQEDLNLTSKFSNKHAGIMRTMKATPEYSASMKPYVPSFKGTHADPNIDLSTFQPTALIEEFKKRMSESGILQPAQMEGITKISELLDQVKAVRDTLPDSLKVELEKIKAPTSQSGKTFLDRLYGGIDFDWENSTGYYPDGLGVTLSGGYEITNNSGLTLECATLFNGSEIGFSEDLRFESKFVSNYTLGANIDYRVWKFVFVGIGAETIINTIEAKDFRYFDDLRDTKLTWGVPAILRILLPVKGFGSPTVDFRYDLNSKNNIKPTFDFKVGFIIGRK